MNDSRFRDSLGLEALVRRGSSAGAHLLVTGGVHGDEYEPVEAIRRLFHRVPPSALRGTLTLVPIVNHSAWQRDDRCGEDGLDLARTCPGRIDGTITEKVAAALSELIRQAEFLIDLHTGGKAWCVSPLAGYMLHENPSVLDRQRQMAQAFQLPIVWGTTAALQGRSLSVARDANVPAIYCEYLGGRVCHPAAVDAYVEGCLNVMATLGMIDRVVRPGQVEYTIEENRPQSGFLQVQHPSPRRGTFEPCVNLNQRVSQGDVLGTVRSEREGSVVEIKAKYSGLIVAIRIPADVDHGEGVVVVLEMA